MTNNEREVEALGAALRHVADIHHRTLTPSRLHDPERQIDFEACECLTCKMATAALRGVSTGTEER